MMRFAMLGSGSRGNATLIAAGSTLVLVDCGFMLRETERRLERLGQRAHNLAAILVTHEHYDHIGGVARLARKYRIPVYLTRGTYESWPDAPVPRVQKFNAGESFTIGELTVQTFPVPHDAKEPCHFVFGNGTSRLGTVSDAGSVNEPMRQALSGCDALLLEFNHDFDMLVNGPYPAALRDRVGGPLGHLSNKQSAELLHALDTSRLRHLVLTHLSEKNNTPLHALAAANAVVGLSCATIECAHQDEGLAWRELN
jgi:phosphoribosyl 1,2-cyclic phosphodiesterase